MRRDLWMVLILGCLLVLLLEAPGALAALSDDLGRPYEVLAAPTADAVEPQVEQSAHAAEPESAADGQSASRSTGADTSRERHLDDEGLRAAAGL